jgi:hypothetical protein
MASSFLMIVVLSMNLKTFYDRFPFHDRESFYDRPHF